MTLAIGGGESDIPACGPPTSSAVTPARSVHKSMGRQWGVYVGAVEEMMCM